LQLAGQVTAEIKDRKVADEVAGRRQLLPTFQGLVALTLAELADLALDHPPGRPGRALSQSVTGSG
jgi:hypothetical protein